MVYILGESAAGLLLLPQVLSQLASPSVCGGQRLSSALESCSPFINALVEGAGLTLPAVQASMHTSSNHSSCCTSLSTIARDRCECGNSYTRIKV
jgi:hypothetical protein